MTSRPAREYRIGVIGTGNIARLVHLPVLTSMPDVRVAWVADVNAASAASVARAFKLRSIALPLSAGAESDCDVVLIASPVGTRLPYLEHLARRGIAAFVEKPFARTVEEHRAFASLSGQTRYGGAIVPGNGRAWLAYARQMGRNRSLTRLHLNQKLFAAEMVAGMPKN